MGNGAFAADIDARPGTFHLTDFFVRHFVWRKLNQSPVEWLTARMPL